MKCGRIIFKRNEEFLQFRGKIFDRKHVISKESRSATITLELPKITFM
jgi:hypothetical protein